MALALPRERAVVQRAGAAALARSQYALRHAITTVIAHSQTLARARRDGWDPIAQSQFARKTALMTECVSLQIRAYATNGKAPFGMGAKGEESRCIRIIAAIHCELDGLVLTAPYQYVSRPAHST